MKNLGIRLIMTVLLLMAASILCRAAADGFNVSGVVSDSKKDPVAGAAVILRGNSAVYAVTDAEGRYSIAVPGDDAILDFSCLNFKSVSEQVAGRAVINVTLEDTVPVSRNFTHNAKLFV